MQKLNLQRIEPMYVVLLVKRSAVDSPILRAEESSGRTLIALRWSPVDRLEIVRKCGSLAKYLKENVLFHRSL